MLPANRPLKILHILDHSLPLHSGYTFRSYNIFRAQLARGWRPVVLTSSRHEASWSGTSDNVEEIGGVRHYRTGALAQSTVPLAAELRLMIVLARRLREVIKREQPDVLHVHSPVLNALPALWVGQALKIPVVYEIRAFWEDAAVDHGTYAQDSWRYKLVKAIETWVCRRVASVAVLCHGLREDLVKRGIPSDKLTAVFNGINAEDFRPCAPDAKCLHAWQLVGKQVISFIGSFYHYEGLDLLLQAMAHLVTTRSDIVLLLVGGGEMELALKEQIQQLHLEKHVVMAGRVPHERIPGVYALTDILVYQRYSQRLTELVTPLKPLEAMGMGKALIASDVGGHCELIYHGHTGLLFPAGDVMALVDALGHHLDDQALRQHLSQQGASWVRQHHTWEQTTSVYKTIYTRVLGNKREL